MPVPRYEVKIRTDGEIYWSSYLFCGLYDLAADDIVRVRYAPCLTLRPVETYATVMEVTDLREGTARALAVDWRDNPDLLCLDKLERCHIYYKRNLIPDRTFPACAPPLRGKIRPAGLSFAVRTRGERPLWVQAIAGLHAREDPIFQKSLAATAARLAGTIKGPRRAARFLHEEAFEPDSGNPPEPRILFQTKAYDPAGSAYPEDNFAVTRERAETIRALRAEFGELFVGGFVPNEYARREYPDCLAAGSVLQADYAALVRRCQICIYTRGLRDSPAFKLGEYLAAGRCIVAESLKTVLPRPLADGDHLLFFQTRGQLIALCHALLADAALRERLGRGARAYYEQEVRPRTRVLRYFTDAFSHEQGDSATHRALAPDHQEERISVGDGAPFAPVLEGRSSMPAQSAVEELAGASHR